MIPGDVPAMLDVDVSVAVTVCTPGVFRVKEKVATPAEKAMLAGKVALPSLLVSATVSVKEVAGPPL
jgi:hypothetical protein